MGLFDSVKDEIEEMFAECCEIPVGTAMGKKIAAAILRDINQLGKSTGGHSYSRNDQLLRLRDGKLIMTKSKFECFYKKAGQIVTAYELLKCGQYSARQVAKTCEMSINTVCKLLKRDLTLKCVCGKLLREHRGWCKYRVSNSPLRQEFLKTFNNSSNGRKENGTCKGATRSSSQQILQELSGYMQRANEEIPIHP
jgi:hypothetical protein